MKNTNLVFFVFLIFISCSKINQVKKTDSFLQAANGSVSAFIHQYDGNIIENSFQCKGGKVQSLNGAIWNIQIQEQKESNNPEALDLEVTFQLTKGKMESAGVAVEFTFDNWSTENYIMAPASVYDGNRFRILPVGYPPYIYDEKDKPLDMPVTVTNIMHLNNDGTSSSIEMLTGNCSTPMMSFYDKKKQCGFILLTEQDTRLGNSGMIIREDPVNKTISFAVTAPGVREYKYVGCNTVKSDDKGADWSAGDQVALRMKLYTFKAKDMNAFYEYVFDVRKALTGQNEYRNIAPFSAISDIILSHHDEYKWYDDGKHAYICNKPESDSPFGHVQTGWSGIPVYAYPQVLKPTPLRIDRVIKSLEYLSTCAGKTGLIYAMSKRGEFFGDNFDDMSKVRSVAMTRRSGLVLYLGLQQLELLKKQDAISEKTGKQLEEFFFELAGGLVDLFDKYGEFGQFVDVESGELDINGSTAGICIGGLAQAYSYFHTSEFLETAEKAARFYVTNHLAEGYSGGGPAEILQAPDSESTAELAESLIVLYEITGKKEWLDMAAFAAYHFSTWVVSYNYKFPQGCDMERVGANVAGSVWASVQNDHSAPGIYILSGDFLLKLYRATGDERFMELLKDIAHNVVHYTTTETNPIGKGSKPGSVSERVNLSDWEGVGGIGNIGGGDSNMAWETVTLLSVLQNPGIYLLTDDDYIEVFDHVNAKVIERTADTIILEIENPTVYDAEVSVFAESKQDRLQPLSFESSVSWPKVSVAKKGKVKAIIDCKTGTVQHIDSL